MYVVIVVVVLVVAVAAYATWTAGRLDRLHARVDAAAAALDALLRRRAEAAAAWADAAQLPVAAIAEVAQAAEVAAEAADLDHDRETVENAVSRALQTAGAAAPDALEPGRPGADDLVDAAVRVTFARRFYNDAVRDARVVRRRRVVRLLRLAGRARLPAYFEIDDTALPAQDRAAAGSPYD